MKKETLDFLTIFKTWLLHLIFFLNPAINGDNPACIKE